MFDYTPYLDDIPNIQNVLSLQELKSARFVKPLREGKNVLLIHERHSVGTYRPHSTVMCVSDLYLNKNMIIPFHRRTKTEQLFIAVKGKMCVYLKLSGKFASFPLNLETIPYREIIIPPNCPVAVHCLEDVTVLSIISSSKDESDIEWEKKTDQLLKNSHLLPREDDRFSAQNH